MVNLIIERTPILNIACLYDSKTKEILKLEVDNHFKPNLLNNIYLGKIITISDGLNGAFIDIKQPDNAFIQRKELLKAMGIPVHKNDRIPLEQLVKRGQLFVSQIEKLPYQTKGAQLTNDISIPGKHVIFMPHSRGVKFSRKAIMDRNMDDLTQQIQKLLKEPHGVIIRSSAINQNISDENIMTEISQLQQTWENIIQDVHLSNVSKCLYNGNSFNLAVEDMITSSQIESIYIEHEDDQQLLIKCGFPKNKILVKKASTSLLIEQGINLSNWLNQTEFHTCEGVSITLNELEAFTIADINSAKYEMNMSKRENVFKVNSIAAERILKIVLLQKISGVLLIDFIDMSKEEQLSFIQHLLSAGYDKINGITIEGFTKLGILELSRKRETESLKNLLSLSFKEQDLLFWNLYEIYVELKRISNHTNTKALELEISEAMYIFMRQNTCFETFPLKIKLKKATESVKKYKIHTLKD